MEELMKQDYELVNFKKYLYQNFKKFRPGGLSVWCNTIPVPVDIFDELFHRSDEFFSLYLDYVFGALLAHTWIEKTFAPFNLVDLPDLKIISNYEHEMRSGFKLILDKDAERIFTLLIRARVLLGQEGYLLNPNALLKALSHKGKKYSRIYIPEVFRAQIYKAFPGAKAGLGKGNYDMFGNVLADELEVYRIGFSDAFAQIFNRMLDFKILCNSQKMNSLGSINRVAEESVTYQTDQNWLTGRTSDGSLWEPFYDGQVKTRINVTHPLYRHVKAEPEKQKAFQALIKKLSEYEMNAMNDKQLRQLENLRKDISRDLWLEYEMDS